MMARTYTGHAGGQWRPPASLIRWWYGDALTDGMWTDRSGHGGHATLPADGAVGSDGLTLDGNSAGATIAPTTAAGWCLWVQPASVKWHGLINPGGGWSGIFSSVNGTLAYHHVLGNAAFSAAPTPRGIWTHIAIMVGDHVGLWWNGLPIANTINPATVERTHGRIGRVYVDDRALNGSITDLMLFSAPLTGDEIADIIARSPGRKVT